MQSLGRGWSFFALILATLGGCTPSRFTVVNCPEKQVSIRLPSDPSEGYRDYGSYYESGFRACINALNSSINRRRSDDTLRPILASFHTYVTGERTAIRRLLRTTIAGLLQDPCDDRTRTVFHALIENINFNASALHKFPAACGDSDSTLMALINNYKVDKN
jgi:hypothetical protein